MENVARAWVGSVALWLISCSSPANLRPGEVAVYPPVSAAGAMGASHSAAGISASAAESGSSAPVPSRPAGGGSSAPVAMSNGGRSGGQPIAPGPALTPISIDETGANNPAGLSAPEVTQLVSGGALGAMKWLYPYDNSVFPRGTVAPLVMWSGNPAADAVFLHMKSSAFEYKGVWKPSIEGAVFIPPNSTTAGITNNLGLLESEVGKQLAIPQAAWEAAARQTLGKNDKLRIEITERADGQIHGPVMAEILIARGAVQGSVYYNSCISAEATGSTGLTIGAGIGSRVMRIPPHGNAQAVSNSDQCVGCHAVSANGTRLVAQRSQSGADLTDVLAGNAPIRAWSTGLTPEGKPDATGVTQFGTMGAFGALYPDGSKYLAGSGAAGIVVIANGVMPLTAATLFDARSGMVVSDTGVPRGAAMPMFSPDGTRLIFNDAAIDGGHGLALMDYDVRIHKASGYSVLFRNDAALAMRPGWPFLLPDNRAAIFVQTTSPDFTSGQAPALGVTNQLMVEPPHPSDLFIVDVATGKSTMLARAMGFATPEDAAANKGYIPEIELHRNYFPTVSPVASGGYFWIYFDSVRHFGSLGATRGIWAAAIDIRPDGDYTMDPSHPAFFVPGQELIGATHHRAFTALDACRPDGAQCETGIDCCAGYCSGTCNPPPTNTCARRDERCTHTEDCCPSDASSELPQLCIAGFCALVELL